MLAVGTVIGGRLRVDRVIGTGGMGVVVAATHLELGNQVAVKVLHDELVAFPVIVERFLREARAVTRLRTDHVCKVFDVGRLDSGAPYIVMELLDGVDLQSVVARGPLESSTAVDHVLQACIALAEAHGQGMVHRDLKPANLFVVRRPDGRPFIKVLDFGIAKAATAHEAKLTQTTSVMGSPGYMSPEQIRSSRDVDLRTDIWALGVTLYQLLAGRTPFAGTQLAEIAVSVMTATPPSLPVDLGLMAVVMRCLEKEPERRYPDVGALAAALQPYGGPDAAWFAGEVRGTVAPSTGPSALPPVTRDAPTEAATHASVTTRSPAPDTAPAPAAPAARTRPPTQTSRASLGVPIAIIIGLTVLITTAVIVAMRSSSSPPSPVATPGAGSGPPAVAAGSATVARDASVSPVIDAAVESAPPDPGTVTHASDPWAPGAAPPPPPPAAEGSTPVAPTDDSPPDQPFTGSLTPAEQAELRAGKLPKRMRDTYRYSARQGEVALQMIADPAQRDEVAAGIVALYCQIGAPDDARRVYARIRSVQHRSDARDSCAEHEITLAD